MIIDQMKDLMYFIHQEVELIDIGIEELNTQLLFEIHQEDLIQDAREISIVLKNSECC